MSIVLLAAEEQRDCSFAVATLMPCHAAASLGLSQADAVMSVTPEP